VVIGKPGRYIDEADAMQHVAGYCVINDVSERESQMERGGTWDKGKGCDTFGPTEPWLAVFFKIVVTIFASSSLFCLGLFFRVQCDWANRLEVSNRT